MEILAALIIIGAVIGVIMGIRSTRAARATATDLATTDPTEPATLPIISMPQMALKTGEVAHVQLNADLMKEVIDREYRGRSSGVSFRIAKGVRYHVGGSRGKLVEVGRHLQIADRGRLIITSQRTVFAGLSQTIDIPHSRIIDIVGFKDGVQLHVSNRSTAPLFRVGRSQAQLVGAVLVEAHNRAV